MSRSVDGSNGELELLRHQLDQLRGVPVRSWLGKLLGFPYDREYVKRKRNGTAFYPESGFAGEDWQLGDRRAMFLDDVAARIGEDRYLCFRLEVENGVLSKLVILGETDGPNRPLRPAKIRTNAFEALEVFYVRRDPDDPSIGFRKRVSARLPENVTRFSPPAGFDDPTEWQSWLLSLESLALPAHGCKLPFGVRRAKPATPDEIEAFETKHRVRVPREIRDFWLASNGASFVGFPVAGTYDVHFADMIDGPVFVLIMGMYGDGTILFAKGPPDRFADVARAPVEKNLEGSVEGRWGSLRQCLEALIEEQRRDLMIDPDAE